MTDSHHIHKHTIRITLFDDVAARTTRSYDRTLPQIRDEILRTTAPTKAQLPLLKLASFGTIRTNRGSLRNNSNVTSISGIEVDFDGEDISFDDALAKLKTLKCRALIYTSPSHTKQRPRWRILFATSGKLDQDMRRVLVRRVDGYFEVIFDPHL